MKRSAVYSMEGGPSKRKVNSSEWDSSSGEEDRSNELKPVKLKKAKKKKRRSSDNSSSDRREKKKHKSGVHKKKDKKDKKKKKVKEKIKESEALVGPEIPPELLERSKKMAPMTEEEWLKQQSVIQRVYDEDTGRTRLIRGTGEVLEEIVSKEMHRQINKKATKGDGDFFQNKVTKKCI